MSSCYNLKLTCAEYWVNGSELSITRNALDLEAYMSLFINQPVTMPHTLNLPLRKLSNEEQKEFFIEKTPKLSILGRQVGIESIEEDEDEQYMSPSRIDNKAEESKQRYRSNECQPLER